MSNETIRSMFADPAPKKGASKSKALRLNSQGSQQSTSKPQSPPPIVGKGVTKGLDAFESMFAEPEQKSKKRKNPTPFESVGAQLALFRLAAGYTQAGLAEAIIISLAKLESIEQGRRPLTLALAQELDRLLETKGALEVAVHHLPDTDVVPIWALEFVDLEESR